ncbi:MAG: type I methionyl aminopeptidase, partial [Candidatus Woesebacteria bacterium]|nr:type I methionyl aminopeptidase [Candidatus Woesebacteria bacterium]
VGVTAYEIDKLAEKLIDESGGRPSFKTVSGYCWSTCININQGVVHGVPSKDIIFKDGDLISIDLGMFYKGFHTDTSISVAINPTKEVKKFIKAGKEALHKAISSIVPNESYIFDISEQIEKTIISHGYSPIKDLTGHGIGKNLHEEPFVPCFVSGLRIETPKIVSGMALAIEVMYTMGNHKLVKENNGWTISTADGKIAGLFEDTVIVTKKGYKVIT